MEQWTCYLCGKGNDSDCDFCYHCGTYPECEFPERKPLQMRKNLVPTGLGNPTHHETFGDIYWNEKDAQWQGVFPPDAEFPFKLAIDPSSVESRAISTSAIAVIGHIKAALPTLRETVAKAMLPNAIKWQQDSEHWDAEAPALTESEFAARICPDTISIALDGSAEIAFTDDDIFSGHWIVVDVSPNGALSNFRMEG
jgi:hypothetical protein